MKDNGWTSAFSLARYLISIEGSCTKLALMITILYEDKLLPRNDWSVSHAAANRPKFVDELRQAGQEYRRIGFAAHTPLAVDAIRRAAERLNLQFEQIVLNSRSSARRDDKTA